MVELIAPGVWRHGATYFVAYGEEDARRERAMLKALTTGDPVNAARIVVSLDHRIRQLDRLDALERKPARGIDPPDNDDETPGRPPIASAGRIKPVNRTAARVLGQTARSTQPQSPSCPT